MGKNPLGEQSRDLLLSDEYQIWLAENLREQYPRLAETIKSVFNKATEFTPQNIQDYKGGLADFIVRHYEDDPDNMHLAFLPLANSGSSFEDESFVIEVEKKMGRRPFKIFDLAQSIREKNPEIACAIMGRTYYFATHKTNCGNWIYELRHRFYEQLLAIMQQNDEKISRINLRALYTANCNPLSSFLEKDQNIEKKFSQLIYDFTKAGLDFAEHIKNTEPENCYLALDRLIGHHQMNRFSELGYYSKKNWQEVTAKTIEIMRYLIEAKNIDKRDFFYPYNHHSKLQDDFELAEVSEKVILKNPKEHRYFDGLEFVQAKYKKPTRFATINRIINRLTL